MLRNFIVIVCASLFFTLRQRRNYLSLSFLLLSILSNNAISSVGIPFRTANYSPLIQIFGIPPMADVDVFRRNRTEISLSTEMISQFSLTKNAQELAVTDGDMYRTTFSYSAKPIQNFQWQLAIPYVQYRGGTIDGFVDEWHKFFGLPNGGRNMRAKDQQWYLYKRNGKVLLDLRKPQAGVGDVLLTGQWKMKQPFRQRGGVQSLTASVKLPTGDEQALLGSGGVDVSVGYAANTPEKIKGYDFNWYTSMGVMWLGQAYYLAEQQTSLVLFGGVGASFPVFASLAIKAQFDANSSFYRDTDITQIGQEALQFTFGGEWTINKSWRLDFGLSEDFIIDASPDVVFHLALYAGF